MSVQSVIAQSKAYKAVAKATEQLRVAMLNADSATLVHLTNDSLSYGHSGGGIDNKATFVKKLLTGATDFTTLDITQQQIVIVNNTAIVRHQLFANTNDNGKPGTVKLAVMQVWVKQGKQWQFVGRQAIKLQ